MRPLPVTPLSLLSALSIATWVLPAWGTITTLNVPQEWQHKDSECTMCIVNDPPWCPTGYVPHPVVCAPVAPWGSSCPHCGAYCSPGSILMLHRYRGHTDCPQRQDCVYERNMDLPGNFVIESHGIGMTDEEVIRAFVDAMGEVHAFSNSPAGPAGTCPMTSWVLRQLLAMQTPVLWIDRDGHPREYMNQRVHSEMVARGCGHAKVLAGYDDRDTYCETQDDLVLVYDPWPSPEGCAYPKSPYWIGADQAVASDTRDLFLSDRVGGVIVHDGADDFATAWSNGRRMVRDESDGSYNVVFSEWGRIYFTKSTRPAEPGTWSAPRRLDRADDEHIALEPTMALSFNPQGHSLLHVVWAQMQAGPADLWFSESFDGGTTWSEPLLVYGSPLEDSRHPSLDVDGEGNLHLVWDETGLEWGREILHSTRTSDADTWTPPVNVSATGTLDSSFPALATSYDGTEWDDPPRRARTVHVAWVETNPMSNASTIVYRYLDPPVGWIPPQLLPPEEITSGIGGTCPSLVVGPDQIAKAVWTTSQEPPEAVPLAASSVLFNKRENGVWGWPVQVSSPDEPPGTRSICPTIAIANGPYCMCMHVAWEEWDLTSGTGDILVAISRQFGLAWSDITRVTYDRHGSRRFPNLAYKNGTDFTKGYDLTWCDPNGHFETFVRFLGTSRGQPQAASAETPPAPVAITLRAWPNPFTDRVTFRAHGRAHPGSLEVLDVSGRRLRSLAAGDRDPLWIWDGRDSFGNPVAPGVYVVRQQGEARATARVIRLR